MGRVERVRWALAGGIVLLLIALVGTLSYSRYRAARGWLMRAQRKSGVSLTRETDGFTYSQSVQGKTLFTLHASKAFQHMDGKWVLHDVVLTLYGLRTDRADRVYGEEFEWDESKGVARAVGDVRMDLQVPPGVATAERHGGASSAAAGAGDQDSVHVVTRGLIFVRELGVAATDETIEFRYGGIRCTARGAEFESSPSAIHLLADVHAAGVLRGAEVDMRAARADFRRDTNVLALAQLVLQSEGRRAEGAAAQVQLRADGSAASAVVSGGVSLSNAALGATGHAGRLEAVFDEKSAPQRATLAGEVSLEQSNAKGSAQGQAKTVALTFDRQAHLSKLRAQGGAVVRSQQAGGASQQMRGETVSALWAADARGRSQMHEVTVEGHATAQSTLARGSTSMQGDSLRAVTVSRAGKLGVDAVFATGHAGVHELLATGAERTTRADALAVHLASGNANRVTVGSAQADGHVFVTTLDVAGGSKKARETAAQAQHARLNAADDLVLLEGDAQVEDEGLSLRAAVLRLHQKSGDADAHGAVTATLSGTHGGEATHVTSDHATVQGANGGGRGALATFSGGAGGRAKLWQGASQVEAARIVMDRGARTITAEPIGATGTVDAVFAGARAVGKRPAAALRVRSRKLVFADAEHRATFAGPVTVEGMGGVAEGAHGEAVFTVPERRPASGEVVSLQTTALDSVTLQGDVRLRQGNRDGRGEKLVYRAGDGSFQLTGTAAAPPRMQGPDQGSVTGTSLLFRGSDSTIVVMGAQGEAKAATGPKQRARIETRLRQKD